MSTPSPAESTAGAALRVRLLGGLALEAAGRELPRPESRAGRALLAWLALHPGVHGRSRVAGVLRPDASEESARQGLRQALWAIRGALGDGAAETLEATRNGVGLREGAVEVDVIALRERAGAGELEAAEQLATATLLPDLDEDWVAQAREELRADVTQMLRRGAEAAAGAGDPEEALRWARLRAELDPLSEAAQGELIRLLAETGDRAAALRAADELRSRLSEELGVVPSAETRQLIEEVLADEPREPRRASTPRVRPAPAVPAVEYVLPPPLAPAAETPPVGRDAELAALRERWIAAGDGVLQLALISGEPGIGKTTTAAAVARQAIEEGRPVLYGRCDEDPVGPYQPFVEALGRAFETGVLVPEQLSPGHRFEIARLLPDVGEGADASALSAAADPEHARYRLFEAIRSTWRLIARDGRGLLVIDDAHWADGPTTALMRHLARSARDATALVIVTFRDTDMGGPAAPMLTHLQHREDVLDLRLRALPEEAVSELVRRAGGDAAPDGSAVHARTGGNPLFVVELMRDLVEGGGERAGAETPAVVRDVIEQRVARLGPDAMGVLRAASVCGAEFAYEDVEALAGLGDDRALGALDAAVEARLVRELPGAPGCYSFEHVLVLDCLADGMTATRRARMHCRLAERLASRNAAPAAVAGHFLAAAPLGDPEQAADWVLRAAREALDALAYEEAAEVVHRALDRLENLDARRRGALLATLGDALDRSGRRPYARAAFAEAAAHAREAGDPGLLGVAALGYKGLAITISRPDAETVALLEEALEAVPAESAALRARLLAALSLELLYAELARADAMGREAVDLARASGNAAALASTLSARHAALWSAEGAYERLSVASQMLRVAQGANEPAAVVQARNWRVMDLLELGKVGEAKLEIAAYAEEAKRLRLARYAWYVPLWESTLASLRGDFAEAERLSIEAHAQGVAAQDPSAENYRLIQQVMQLADQRRFADIDLEAVEEKAEQSPAGPGAWLGWIAWLAAERGEHERARKAFDALAAGDFALLPRDSNWHAAVEAAEAAVALGDEDAGRFLLDRLEPFADLTPVVARGIGWYGPVSYYTGRLRLLLGDAEAAVERLSAALATAERVGAAPRAALARLRRAEARAAAGDAEGGAEDERAAREAMAALRMEVPED